jgi:hypothetical protein
VRGSGSGTDGRVSRSAVRWVVAVLATTAGVVAVGYLLASRGPRSFRSEYRRRAGAALAAAAAAACGAAVTDDDLVVLPPSVAAYVRWSGAVGRPRVRSFRALVHGRIRGGPDEPWMVFTGEQTSTYAPEPTRVFHMVATRRGLPVDVLHVFAGRATMRARVCSVLPVVDTAGADLDRAETVTLFNDLCVLAPAALVDAPVDWEPVDDHRVRGTFHHGAAPVSAELVFDDSHRLVDFVSDDRLRSSADGAELTRQRWSTPVGRYREIGGRRLATWGEGRWHAPDPEGEFAYLELVVDEITYEPWPGDEARSGDHGVAQRSLSHLG